MNTTTNLKKYSIFKYLSVSALSLFLLSRALHASGVEGGRGSTEVLRTEITRSTGKDGVVTETRTTVKVRTRTVVDFEEASIEGKLKKPNAAYLLHGADLEFKHLYRVRDDQRMRLLGSYEYLR